MRVRFLQARPMNLLKPAQAVIYTSDMEPITVIDMKPWYWDFLKAHTCIRFHVKDEPYQFFSLEHNDTDFKYRLKEVRVHANYIHRGDDAFFLLTTDDEVDALLLDSTVLPGQQRRFNEEKKKAFVRGLLSAFSTRCGE